MSDPVEDTVSTTEQQPTTPPPASKRQGFVRAFAPVVAAFLVGAGAAYALTHHSSNGPSAAGAVTPSQGGGGFRGGFGGGGFGRGGFAGQRIQGTVTATTASTVTIKSSSGGTTTYDVATNAQILKDGQQASVTDLAAGDQVFGRTVQDSSGKQVVQLLFVGTFPGGAPGGGGFGQRTRTVPGLPRSQNT
jgi:hypothetical protein